MHVVLFGASGTIGQRIAREARARGHQVTAVVRHPANVEGLEGVSVVQGDVTDPAGVARVVRGADAVVSGVSPRGGQPWRGGGCWTVRAFHRVEALRGGACRGAGGVSAGGGWSRLDLHQPGRPDPAE